MKISSEIDVIDDLFNRYRVVKLVMDQTGMGEKPVEDAIRRYGESRVEGVMLSGHRPFDIATKAKGYFEKHQIRIPEGNPIQNGSFKYTSE